MSWSRGHELGHGATATVYLATDHRSGERFAVKSAGVSQSEFLQREQRILSSLSSPYVIGYRGWEITKEEGRIVYNLKLEYMPGGTIVDEIRRGGGRIEESTIGFYTWQVVKALEYLHSNGLAHCDVKGRNILVGPDGSDVKLADFGCAKRVESSSSPGSIGGTPMFMAPETARGEEQGFAGDVWGLGCAVIEMATGESSRRRPGFGNFPGGLLWSGPGFPRLDVGARKGFLGQVFEDGSETEVDGESAAEASVPRRIRIRR
ncbi:unnamed protein product [Linum tenue]|uniref:Protein kinase domain-containing protein n=1 Tax=Linum tenue TaxID=586396 RepID=A0AAV0R2U8_9ROSI|nr:unnamed protein product [Linum tenue]